MLNLHQPDGSFGRADSMLNLHQPHARRTYHLSPIAYRLSPIQKRSQCHHALACGTPGDAPLFGRATYCSINAIDSGARQQATKCPSP